MILFIIFMKFLFYNIYREENIVFIMYLPLYCIFMKTSMSFKKTVKK